MAPRTKKFSRKTFENGKEVTTTVVINYGSSGSSSNKKSKTNNNDIIEEAAIKIDSTTTNGGGGKKKDASDSNNKKMAALSSTGDEAVIDFKIEEIDEDEENIHNDNEDDAADNDDDEDDEDDDEDSCLHCHRNFSNDVQVRCDECGSYICNNCHWCHEFQANHEIRVCDRCDAFYCRGCDEMDQCDDCGEVVCASCSTLLSCKFCGCGLCEDCATACGRCGIVLCSKDAKFAVECDTCRMPYCLVCLASGNKDPCVRCGHRPSKRMEQLVHLRLKSIYKAFKQSSTSSSAAAAAAAASVAASSSTGSGGKSSWNGPRGLPSTCTFTATGKSASITVSKGSGRSRNASSSNSAPARSVDECLDEYDLTDDPAALMMAAAATASAAVKSSSGKGSTCTPGGSSSSGGSSTDSAKQRKREAAAAAGANAVREAVEKYKAEKAKADAAAAALLAELDEEEEQVNAKKSRKKKKRGKQQQQQQQQTSVQDEQKRKEEDRKVASKVPENRPARPDSPSSHASSNPSLTAIVPGGASLPKHNESTAADNPPSTVLLQSTFDDDDGWQQTTRKQKSPSKTVPGDPDAMEEDEELIFRDGQPSKDEDEASTPEVDPLEQQYEELVDHEDVEGLTELLASIKGVVGKAVLRKNLKKAIKRFKAAAVEAEEQQALDRAAAQEEEVIAAPSVSRHSPVVMAERNPSADGNRPGTVTPVVSEQGGSLQPGELLRIVSQQTKTVPSFSSSSKEAPPVRAECIMHISPLIVGWVIGKDGRRIEKAREDSGAKIWIDQKDFQNPNDPRVVFISGEKKNVESAVGMMKGLVAESPLGSKNAQAQKVEASAVGPQAAATDVAKQKVAGATAPADSPTGVPISTEAENERHRPRRANSHHAGKKANGEANRARHIITCDPRFVPLLIGRRGWTVKNIQDSSGARVDIDQTVTPRRITVSGSDTGVEIAVRMVRDVLSYPDSQLHNAGGRPSNSHHHKPIGQQDEPEHYPLKPEHFPLPTKPEDFPVPRKPEEIAAAAAAEGGRQPSQSPSAPSVPKPVERVDIVSSPAAAETSAGAVRSAERPHSPPPSSLIMPDAKSTISASSSLSSTPEPSMNSSSKGNVAPVAPAPILPTTFSSGQGGQIPHSSPSKAHGGLLATGFLAPHVRNDVGLGPPLTDPQPSPSLSLVGPSMLQNNHSPSAMNVGGHQLRQAGPFPVDPTSTNPQAHLPMHQQSAFQSSGPGFSSVQATPTSLRGVSNPHLQGLNSGGTASAGSGLWNQGPAPPLGPAAPTTTLPSAQPAAQDYGFAAAVDFLHHSASPPSQPTVLPTSQQRSGVSASGGMNSLLGLPSPARHVDRQQRELSSLAAATGLDRPLVPPGTPGREESRMVDSLFGPSDLGGSNTDVVGGLRGLSLGNDTVGTGLWGATTGASTTIPGDSLSKVLGNSGGGLGPGGLGGNPVQDPQSALFSTGGSGLDAVGVMNEGAKMNESQRNGDASQSRFSWGQG